MCEHVNGMSSTAADLGTYMLYMLFASFPNGGNAEVVIFMHTHAAVHCRHTRAQLQHNLWIKNSHFFVS